MRRAAKVDASQSDIVDGLRAMGYSVTSLAKVGNGCPDIVVGAHGHNVLIEIKVPGEKLTVPQKKWHTEWKGRAQVVYSFAEALMVVKGYA
jgi:Holliday junction resolvase